MLHRLPRILNGHPLRSLDPRDLKPQKELWRLNRQTPPDTPQRYLRRDIYVQLVLQRRQVRRGEWGCGGEFLEGEGEGGLAVGDGRVGEVDAGEGRGAGGDVGGAADGAQGGVAGYEGGERGGGGGDFGGEGGVADDEARGLPGG